MKLDTNSGFFQIPLAEESRLLTTFMTLFGRYVFKRLPFGITSVPEHFQRRMSHILEGLDGQVCLMDDVLVYGSTPDEHDQRLSIVLQCLLDAGVSLNPDKCKFRRTQIRFVGHILDHGGIFPNPEKVLAIQEMAPCQNLSDV